MTIQLEAIAEALHDAYERLAPSYGYETREASRVDWDELPQNHRDLMVAAIADSFPFEELAKCREALRMVEFVYAGWTVPYCPWCDGRDVHKPYCPRQQALESSHE